MKFWTPTLIALATFTAPSNSIAQPAQPGDIGIYFDSAATLTATTVVPFELFSFYVIATDVPTGQETTEFLIDIDPRVTIGPQFPHPASFIEFCDGVSPNRRNFCAAYAGACVGEGTTVTLVRWEAFVLTEETDLSFCLTGAETNFSPPYPQYLACNRPGDLRRYGAAYEGCAVANPVTLEPPVATRMASWGSVKARF